MKFLNKIKNSLGEQNIFVAVSRKIVNGFFCLTSLISPSLNTKLRYRYNFGKAINLKNPNTFIEKCNWYKLNIVNKQEIYRKCSDKYAVRSYLEQTGCKKYLNDLIAVYDSVDAINWSELPDSFVMKINDGCGYYIICDDKNQLNISESKKQLKKWWHEHNYLLYSELQNKSEKRRIIVEKYIHGPENLKRPVDYKFYCFNGTPVAVLVIMDRGADEKVVMMSMDWKPYSKMVKGYTTIDTTGLMPEKPRDYEEMIECVKKMSSTFPFVRVDLYQSDNGPVFGELTFTCAGAMFTAHTDDLDLNMAELFKLPINELNLED